MMGWCGLAATRATTPSCVGFRFGSPARLESPMTHSVLLDEMKGDRQGSAVPSCGC